MISLLKSDTILEKYYLVDWSKRPSKWRANKIIKMTSYEAWSANQGFGLNGATLRYIKK